MTDQHATHDSLTRQRDELQGRIAGLRWQRILPKWPFFSEASVP